MSLRLLQFIDNIKCNKSLLFQNPNAEMVHFDSVLLLFAMSLAFWTAAGVASAFFLLIHALFPLFRDPLIYFFGKMRLIISDFCFFKKLSLFLFV